MRLASLMLFLFVAGHAATAQSLDAGAWTAHVGAAYRVAIDVTYLKAGNYDLKLDVYVPRDAKEPLPTALYFHGGGWVTRSKEYMALNILPYLEMGWAVVNVGYRLGTVANAPAAVEDCRFAGSSATQKNTCSIRRRSSSPVIRLAGTLPSPPACCPLRQDWTGNAPARRS